MIYDKGKEWELLLSCVKEHLGLGNEEEIRRAAADIDWGFMADLAESQGVLPIFYKIIWKSIPELVPKQFIKDLRFKYLQNSHKNHFLSAELINILNFLESNGLHALPFKGPVLAEFLYGGLSLRCFSDLDLLVPMDDALKASHLLESRGYRQIRKLNREQEIAFLRSKHHYHLIHPITGVHVDLHWRIAPKIYSFSLDSEDLMERSITRMFQGKKVQTISNEDALLILCEHGIRHYWKKLIWVCDVAIIARLDKIDWRQLFKNASDTGCLRALLLGILLAKDLLDAPLPRDNGDIFKQIQIDKEVSSLTNEISHRIFSEKLNQKAAEIDDLKADADEELLYLRARERNRDRALYYIRRITTPTEDDWDSFPLPGYLFPLYHFIRPIRLIGRYKFRLGNWRIRN